MTVILIFFLLFWAASKYSSESSGSVAQLFEPLLCILFGLHFVIDLWIPVVQAFKSDIPYINSKPKKKVQLKRMLGNWMWYFAIFCNILRCNLITIFAIIIYSSLYMKMNFFIYFAIRVTTSSCRCYKGCQSQMLGACRFFKRVKHEWRELTLDKPLGSYYPDFHWQIISASRFLCRTFILIILKRHITFHYNLLFSSLLSLLWSTQTSVLNNNLTYKLD